ncbi:alginate lyase family protein [Streptomyces sp. ID05-39B]|uniref:alginate lyase family protein n=1 Tax=Streptomyces sp. ID05-39B TaxID=3028664 RepID=UPI0029BD3707|nr:alginate lyase family protein [Streptomyces sp. ID05-39B]MDX3529785.1 alginate lyase family protein [Streptomyces sp. ID05-39B]
MSPIGRRGLLKSSTALLLAAGAGTSVPSPAQAAAGGTAGTFTFTHPGLLHSATDLARMKSAVDGGQSSVYDGYLALAAHGRSQTAYNQQNTGQITSWGRGPSNFMGPAVADSAAAYQNALLWAVTGNRAHADKARDILDTWSASLTVVTGADGPLGAGLQAFKFLNAAELLRHTGYDGWPDADITRCERSFLDVWYPAVSGYMPYANGNWDLTALQTILAVGVFCEERTLFEDALRFAATGAGNGSVVHRIVTAAGQGQESGRDQGHEQLAVGLLGDVAQVAWNQGVDLWGFDGHRILANAEYAARYNLGGAVPFTPDLDRTGKYIRTTVSDKVRGTLPPIYEMYYAHYAGVRGLDAPNTEAAVFRGTGASRVVEGANDDLPGWGTFAYAGAAATEPDMPVPPAGVTAVGEEKAITVSWLPSAGATGYTVLRAERIDGPYEAVSESLGKPAYADTGVRAGRTYHYTVSGSGVRGEGGRSTVVTASAGLPAPWTTADIGAMKIPGSARFDGERFVLEASGTAETYRSAHLPLHGDGTVTARVVWPLSSQYSKIGVTVRASLEADAPHASMLIQGLPLHTWSGVWTVRPRAGAPVRGTGSTAVPPSQQEAITTRAAFPISDLGELPESATPLAAPHVEGAGDGYRLRMPYWVRVTREGRRCTGAISTDGMRWTVVGTTEVDSMPKTVYAGLLLTSSLGVDEAYADTGTGAFDNVSVTSPDGDLWRTPRPTRTASDLRATAGSAGVLLAWTDPDLAARYTVLRAPRPHGPYRALATDVAAVGFGARVRYTDASGTPGATYHYAVAKANCAGSGPRSAAVSALMPEATVTSARLSSVVSAPLPAPWDHGDLGDVVLDRSAYGTLGVAAVLTPGEASHDSDGILTVRGAGSDLNINSQGMTGHFVRQTVTGDCEVTARLLSREGATADRVGLLMAKSFSPFDQAAGLIVTGGSTAQLMLRPTVAGASAFTGTTTVRLPLLLRLKRVGTAFSAAVSTDDGATWTPLAQGQVPDFGNAPFYVGPVVCSRSQPALCTARFSEVMATSR